jgi:hypothetical protein
MVHYDLAFGASTAITGDVAVDLPVTPHSSYQNLENEIGRGTLRDATGSRYAVRCLGGATATTIRAVLTSGTYDTGATLSSTVPFTWTTSDKIGVQAIYEAA